VLIKVIIHLDDVICRDLNDLGPECRIQIIFHIHVRPTDFVVPAPERIPFRTELLDAAPFIEPDNRASGVDGLDLTQLAGLDLAGLVQCDELFVVSAVRYDPDKMSFDVLAGENPGCPVERPRWINGRGAPFPL
jgi:hypothetical protein